MTTMSLWNSFRRS